MDKSVERLLYSLRTMKLSRLLPAVVVVALSLTACPGKYARYASPYKDWTTFAPYGWTVMFDHEDTHFTNVEFIGPFDPFFYLGAPSFSVRWHEYGRAHRLRDGLLESYASADDYIKQMLDTVYGPKYRLVSDTDPTRDVGIESIKVSGRPAKHFVVLSPVAVPADTKWGATTTDPETGKKLNLRAHEYVVVPLERGFYVLIYPATMEGRFPEKFTSNVKKSPYTPMFQAMVNGFTILKDGPDGQAGKSAQAPAAPVATKKSK